MAADTPDTPDPRRLQVGEHWAYRARTRDSLDCVEVKRIGTARPPRVLVRFVADEFEGREDWVSPARLKVPWGEAEVWLAGENRVQALRDASRHIRDTPDERAADLVLDSLVGWRLAEADFAQGPGVLIIYDVEALAADTGLDRDLLIGDPLAIEQGDGQWLVPWRVMRQVVARLAQVHADQVMPAVEADEDEDRRHAVWGYQVGYGARASYISADACAEASQKHGYPLSRELVRQWCGQEAQDRSVELRALRTEVVRLGQLVERAITALRRGGHTREATALERELGVPVEVIRRRSESQRSSGP